jgi:hypothetical protein
METSGLFLLSWAVYSLYDINLHLGTFIAECELLTNNKLTNFKLW